MRGRRPDPAALQEAKGNPGRRRPKPSPAADETAAATPPPAAIEPTVALAGLARRVWDHLAPELDRLKFLRDTDRDAFTRYCYLLSCWWSATSKLSREDVVYWTESAHGKLKRINPLFIVQLHLEKRLLDHEDRFGLSPAARQRIMLHMAGSAPLPPGGGLFPPPAQPEAPASPIGILAPPQVH